MNSLQDLLDSLGIPDPNKKICSCGDGKYSGTNLLCPIHGSEDSTDFIEEITRLKTKK